MRLTHAYMAQTLSSSRNPWSWIPSLYFIEGLPYVVVMTVSVAMFKNFGISNTDIALYTSLLYLPWVAKPLWSPVVDIIRTKRWWTLSMQGLMAVGFLGIAFGVQSEAFFVMTLAWLWVLAISSATHDIAADGFYMLALRDDQQAFFVGIRSTFYRLAMMSGEGGILIMAGYWSKTMGVGPAWRWVFIVLAIGMGLAAILHAFILPRPEAVQVATSDPTESEGTSFWTPFITFIQKPDLGVMVAFILLYRLGEAQLVKLAVPFLLDPVEAGGLALTTEVVGWINGTVGVPALVAGGILGGFLVSRHGLKFWLWWMMLAINLPNLIYVAMAYFQPSEIWMIATGVGIEKFGYGLGFTAFMMYLIYIARGSFQTAHYAIATGLMALGMMLPGMISGWLQTQLGYTNFFVWVAVAALPAFGIATLLKIDPAFGRKDREEAT